MADPHRPADRGGRDARGGPDRWPEARIILAQAVVHNALAPKSNAAYLAIAIADVRAGKGGLAPHRGGAARAGRLGHGEG